jgi:hypothetical protein
MLNIITMANLLPSIRSILAADRRRRVPKLKRTAEEIIKEYDATEYATFVDDPRRPVP